MTIDRQPRQARSSASASPIGPPPTIKKGVRVPNSKVPHILEREQLLRLAIADEVRREHVEVARKLGDDSLPTHPRTGTKFAAVQKNHFGSASRLQKVGTYAPCEDKPICNGGHKSVVSAVSEHSVAITTRSRLPRANPPTQRSDVPCV